MSRAIRFAAFTLLATVLAMPAGQALGLGHAHTPATVAANGPLDCGNCLI